MAANATNKKEPIYAVAPINVGGTFYETGDEIECGEGARRSLLRFAQATTEEPRRGDGETGERGDEETPETEFPDGHTSLEVLKLDAPAVKALLKHKLASVELVEAYLSDKQLSDLQGIGPPTEEKILAALEAYRDSDEE